jgi:hypothetical protein
MQDWKKIITSETQAELESLQLTGNGEAATLKVLGSIIKFHGLPTSDPHVVGALYKDPSTITGVQSLILISNGPPTSD